MKVNNRVVCAANKCLKTGKMVLGLRHFDEFMRDQMDRISGPCWATSEQGFIDNSGTFLTREEALEIAKREGQIVRSWMGDSTKLFSENLY